MNPSRRQVRRPVVWACVAALLGAGVGAAVVARTAAADARVQAQDDRGERGTLGLEAGPPRLVGPAGPISGDGSSTVELSVPMSSRSADLLRFSVLRLDAAGAASGARTVPIARQYVERDLGTVVRLPLAVRCAEFRSLEPGSEPRGRPDLLRVSVAVGTDDRRHDATLVLPRSPSGTVTDLVISACGPPPDGRASERAPWTPLPDGSLELAYTVRHPIDDVRVELRQTPGLGVRSDLLPAGAVTLTGPGFSDGRYRVVLTMDPTCSALGPRGQGAAPSFDVVTLVDGEVVTTEPDGDGAKAAWTASQVARRCG